MAAVGRVEAQKTGSCQVGIRALALDIADFQPCNLEQWGVSNRSKHFHHNKPGNVVRYREVHGAGCMEHQRRVHFRGL